MLEILSLISLTSYLISFTFTFAFVQCEQALKIILVVITNLTTVWSVTLRSYGGFCKCRMVKSYILLLFCQGNVDQKCFVKFPTKIRDFFDIEP